MEKKILKLEIEQLKNKALTISSKGNLSAK